MIQQITEFLKSGLHLSCRPSSINNNTNLAGKKISSSSKIRDAVYWESPNAPFRSTRYFCKVWGCLLFWWFWVPKIDCQLDVFDVILNCFFPLFFYTKKESLPGFVDEIFEARVTHVFTFQASKKAPHLRRPTWHEPAVCSHPTYPRWSVKACWHSVKSTYPNVWNIYLLKRHSWFPATRSSRFSDDIQPLFTVSEIFKQKAHFRSLLVTTFTIYKQFNLLLKCKLAIQTVSTSIWCNLQQGSEQCAKVNPGPHKVHDPRSSQEIKSPQRRYPQDIKSTPYLQSLVGNPMDFKAQNYSTHPDNAKLCNAVEMHDVWLGQRTLTSKLCPKGDFLQQVVPKSFEGNFILYTLPED